jgi:hypothetical protein
MADYWRKKLNKLFEPAGLLDERATHHRFRHTFARLFCSAESRWGMLRIF